MRHLLLAACALAAMAAGRADAATVTLDLPARILAVTGIAGIAVGDRLDGGLSFDSEATPTSTGPSFADFDLAGTGGSISLNGGGGLAVSLGVGSISLFNNGTTADITILGVSDGDAELHLAGKLAPGAVPLASLAGLGAAALRGTTIFLSVTAGGIPSGYLEARVVPLPAAGALALAGLAALTFLRARRR